MFNTLKKNIRTGLKLQYVNSKRYIITGPKKTGSNGTSMTKTGISKGNTKESKSSSPFDSSFTFQLFLIVGAMGAGYTLGKTTIMNSPPGTLFPAESTTNYEILKEYEQIDKEREGKQYDMFKRCILRILESKGIEVDMKYGKNEFLYDEKCCNNDISDIMNNEDGLGDVFFGKNPETWEGKDFIWYPENTDDVSIILKYCDEFKIPVYTKTSKIQQTGLNFQIDFSNFKTPIMDNDDNNLIKFNINISNEKLNDKLKQFGISNECILNNELNSVDLFLLGCGIKLPYFNNLVISDRFDINSISGIECVLPDGKVLTVEKDIFKRDDFKLFELLTKFQDELCVITNFYINKKDILLLNNNSNIENNLIVIGCNDLNQLNDNIKEIKQKVDKKVKISIIDNNGSNDIVNKYGKFKTFALFKLNDKELSRLSRKFNDTNQGDENMKFMKFQLDELLEVNDKITGSYFSDKVTNGNSAIIVNLLGEFNDIKTYYEINPIIESHDIDNVENIDNFNRDLLRRIKLSIDSNRILNRNAGISVIT